MEHQNKHKYTPSPWHPRIKGVRGACKATVRCIDGDHVAEVYCNGDYNNIENAHLIAAAPDLLEALEGLICNLKLKDMPTKEVEKCLRAINKARGV